MDLLSSPHRGRRHISTFTNYRGSKSGSRREHSFLTLSPCVSAAGSSAWESCMGDLQSTPNLPFTRLNFGPTSYQVSLMTSSHCPARERGWRLVMSYFNTGLWRTKFIQAKVHWCQTLYYSIKIMMLTSPPFVKYSESCGEWLILSGYLFYISSNACHIKA